MMGELRITLENCKAQKLRRKKVLRVEKAKEEKVLRVETKVQIVLRRKLHGERIKCEGREEKIREEMKGTKFRRKIKG